MDLPASLSKEAVLKASKAAVHWAGESGLRGNPKVKAAIVTLCMWFGPSWLLRSLLYLFGMGSAGPIAGTLMAWWQSMYGGYVPAGSLFATTQRLGMTMGRGLFPF
ncbi:hypothetical protein GGR56DRAFT_397594 [Xylariaceae sp. FL0804]|nr:hypothetical protein GGR56DRAFT_397594 [Xylariaceae sp. FL0804]